MTPECRRFCIRLAGHLAFGLRVVQAWTIAESGGGTRVVPQTPNNFVNVGNTDSNPTGGSTWPTPEDAADGTYEWLRKNPLSGAVILAAGGKSEYEQLESLWTSPFSSSRYGPPGHPGEWLLADYASLGPPPSPQEDDMLSAIDPKNGNLLISGPDGAPRIYGPDGGPPVVDGYLGGLNSHPSWSAGGSAANGPVVAVWFRLNDTLHPQRSGYGFMCRDANGNDHPYFFPADGSLK